MCLSTCRKSDLLSTKLSAQIRRLRLFQSLMLSASGSNSKHIVGIVLWSSCDKGQWSPFQCDSRASDRHSSEE